MRTNQPRNEGRVFKAWCGPEYMLIWNSRGKLTTRLHTGQFWVIDSLTSFWQEMINKLGSTLDTEAGLEKIKQRLEREYIIPSMKDDRRPPPSYNFKAR